MKILYTPQYCAWIQSRCVYVSVPIVVQVASLQYDFVGGDDDPFPDVSEEQQHGTNVAGVIAMEKGNGECGVGVAYNAAITGQDLDRY